MGLKQQMEIARKESAAWKQLIAQRDELLAAARRGIMALEANGAPNCEAAKELRAAIANAERS